MSQQVFLGEANQVSSLGFDAKVDFKGGVYGDSQISCLGGCQKISFLWETNIYTLIPEVHKMYAWLSAGQSVDYLVHDYENRHISLSTRRVL